MDFNDVISLIRENWFDEFGKPYLDEHGNQYAQKTDHEIYCIVESIRQSEHYTAGLVGLKPEAMFIVVPSEYSGERLVKHGEQEYTVLRTYKKNHERLEIIAQKKVANEKS